MESKSLREFIHENALKRLKRVDLSNEIERRKYYEGFNVGREKQMFKEELEDLEKVYTTALMGYAQEMEDVLPSLLHFMDKFITVHKRNEAVREKLDALMEKTGRELPNDNYGEDHE